MKKFTYISTFFVCFAIKSLQASITSQPGSWDIQGEYLYLLPMVSESNYAVNITPDTTVAIGENFSNELDFHHAYRVEGVYTFHNCFNDFRVVWTHLPKFSDTSSTTSPSPTLFPTQGQFDFATFFSSARSKISLEYYAIDALAGFHWLQCDKFTFLLQAGLHYAHFHFKEELTFTAPSNTFSLLNKSRLWGIGPELTLGLDYILPFGQNLFSRIGACGLEAKLRGALLASRRFGLKSNTHTTLFLDVSDDSIWDTVSFWDIRINFNYHLVFQSFNANLKIGYEVLSYRDAISRVQYAGFGTISNNIYSDANFQGPFAALSFSF